MRVYIWPEFGAESGQGGIKRVVEGLQRWLPEFGIDLVNDPNKADIVNSHADEFDTKLPVAASLHGLYWSGYPWAHWCYRANDKLIRVAKSAESVSVPSHWVHRAFARGMLLSSFVLMHGVDTDEFEVQPNDGYVMWAKTRVDPICTPAPLAELARRSPEIRFLTTFGGEDSSNVTRLGKVDYQTSRNALARAGLYLGTTLETGGITCLESMAYGVPVLGYDWGANSEIIIHKETGYLVPPDDMDALEEGLWYCHENRERLSESAREYVRQNFKWEDRIKDYIPFYQAALDAKKHEVGVSIVVTAHNLDNYLPACLDSLLKQTYENWECIIVDDASPDNCGAIADDYANRDSRFKVIHNTQNAYLAEARNIGFRGARGKYFLALDADDQLSPNGIKLLAEALDKNKHLDLATGGFELVEPDGRHWTSGWPTSNPSYEQQIIGRNQIFYASMQRRWVWERTGGYRRRYRTAEDADYWTRAMSYGAVPAKVTDASVLVYANRPDSMSHTEGQTNWTDWMIWSKLREVTPFGAACNNEEYSQRVHAYGPTQVSVIIPCGPGHDFYLQDALDSLVAQTFLDWEAIVVNDTGQTWFDEDKLINPYLAGFPFVKIVEHGDPSVNHGVSWARNAGIEASTAPLFVLLDADDFMQPLMLDVLMKVHEEYGGWVYSDWYSHLGEHKEAQNWNADGLVEKMLGPSTGLYVKKDWEDIGGFDEKTLGWEDWIYQLDLLERGICGSHVSMPLFTYRYQTGTRREDNFSKQKELVKYIKAKFKRLNEDKEFLMACRSCGGGGGQNDVVVGMTASEQSAGGEPMVLMEFVGPAEQMMHVRSKINAKRTYRFGGKQGNPERRFFVYEGDAQWMEQQPTNFKRVPMPKTSVGAPKEIPVLAADATRERPLTTPLSVLGLAQEVITILEKGGIYTVEDVQARSLTDLITIKGMGAARARKAKSAASTFVPA